MRTGLLPLFASLLAAATQAAPIDVTVHDARGRPLAGAVVLLDSPGARAAARPMPAAEIGQEERRFVPEVSVVTLGTAVTFPNRDSVRHHVYSFSSAKSFELKLYSGKPANPVVFDRSGIAVLGCNIHDQMVAWVMVVETPYHGRSGPDGRARLDAPSGAYQLRAWHPDLPPGAAAAEAAVEVGTAPAAATIRVPVTAATVAVLQTSPR